MIAWILIVHLTGYPNVTTFVVDNIVSEAECYALSDNIHKYRLASKVETLCFAVNKVK
jgi:hypothetical protein